MLKRPLIVMPVDSPETRFSVITAIDVVNWFRSNGYSPITLNGITTLRPGFTSTINGLRNAEDPPHLLIYLGHGLPDSLLGAKPMGEPMPALRPVVAGGPYDNADILNDFIVYAVACDTLAVLGPEAVRRGAVTYYSNKEPLHVLRGDIDHDFSDDFTQLYGEIPKSLGEGRSTGEAFARFRQIAGEMRMHAPAGSDERTILDGVLRDFGMLGDPNARWG